MSRKFELNIKLTIDRKDFDSEQAMHEWCQECMDKLREMGAATLVSVTNQKGETIPMENFDS